MDTSALKKFAQAARQQLMDQVSGKLSVVMQEGSAARREKSVAIAELQKQIDNKGREQVVEEVAYTWFNRFTALRFMDVNDYTTVRAVSPSEGATRPELLAEAMAGNLPEGAPEAVQALLSGRAPSTDPQGEAYRLLLVHTCDAWHDTMPYMFEKIDDYSEVLIPDDLLSSGSFLASLREVMTAEACLDVEIIGWLYQFYISEKKDEVFAGLKKNKKITPENIPAATQLFTPHWIVRYLVENSLGRLWLLNRPDSRLAERMDYYIAPEEPETDFLEVTRPEEIRICDPAAGSGHMLTYAFDLLYAIYEEEGYDAIEIPALILTHNLTGVEIDDRAGALAAFALAMKAAARLGRRRFLRMEVKPDICVLQNVSFTEAEMQDVAAVVGRDLFTDELRETLGQFEQAKNFGSLIVPRLRDPAAALRVVEARDIGGDLLLKEVQERVIAVLRMAEALSPKCHVVVANPPYMGGKGMNAQMSEFAKDCYPDSKADLYAMFMERALRLNIAHGIMAMINMQSWMFLSSFEALRTKLLSSARFLSMAHLGTRGFDSIGGEVVATTAFAIQKSPDKSVPGIFLRLLSGSNESEKSSLAKAAANDTQHSFRFSLPSIEFERLPGSPIAYWFGAKSLDAFKNGTPLSDYVSLRKGLTTMDNARFLKGWQEVARNNFFSSAVDAQSAEQSKKMWFPVNKGGGDRKWYGLNELVINWKDDGKELKEHIVKVYKGGSYTKEIRSEEHYFRENITWSALSASSLSMRYSPPGYIFESMGSVALATTSDRLRAAIAYANSKVINLYLEALSPTLAFNAGPVGKCPVVAFGEKSASERAQALVILSKSDWDAYETSWDFTALPLLSPDHRGATLADSYATLRAHWQSMTDEMKASEEENNRIFIDAYGLQDELTPEVPIEEITLTCNPAYRYGVKGSEEDRETRLRADTMAEFLSYAVGCMFGRYSLDEPGLILANAGETLQDYLARVPNPSFEPDADNVVPVLEDSWFSDDIVDRFRRFLIVTFGEEHLLENLAFIEEALGKDIRKYFTKDFYSDHVKRYKKRPIYWLFSSPKGTFNALIYMHRYQSDTVSILLNDYLRDFISKLEAERVRLDQLSTDDGAPKAQQTKAMKDLTKVSQQLSELKEWERDVIFPLAQQRIEIELDDGVKANYPKFGSALKKIAGLETKGD